MNRFIGYAASVLAAIWLLLSSLMSCALNEELYDTFQRFSGVTAERAQVSEEMRMLMNRELAMYLAGEGALTDVFNEKERAHMADVKGLFDTARGIMTACFVLSAAGCVFSFFRARDKLIKRYLIGCGAVFGILVALAVLCALDFSSAFTLFHKALFTNDLWFMDVATDAIIRIFPEKVFVYMCVTILVRAGLRMALLWLLLRAAMYFTGRSGKEI